jgi:hypothetical protein
MRAGAISFAARIRKTAVDAYLQRMFKAFEFCLPTNATKVPAGPEWLHEIKHDGFRLRVERDGGRVRLVTRGGYDWTKRYPWIVESETNGANAPAMPFAGVSESTGAIWLLGATHLALDRRRAVRTFMRLGVGSECCRLESFSFGNPLECGIGRPAH